MPPPDPLVVKVAIETLATAGTQWSERGADLSHIPSTMGDLDMTGLQMGLAAPIHGVYEQIHTGIRRLMGEAGTAADEVGAAMTTAAKAYAKDEADGVHALKGLW
ncbi:MAG TPA: hypothetical protein VIM10_08945 [Actinopolymorphaceae bacterium]|jgi:hypothetical protein